MEELKPCPFCGGKAEIYASNDNDLAITIGCRSFGCYAQIDEDVPIFYFERDHAVEAWNRRSK